MKTDVKEYSELPLTLTVEHVAGILMIGINQAYNLVRSQGFPKIKIGRQTVIPKQAFINWMDSQVQLQISERG